MFLFRATLIKYAINPLVQIISSPQIIGIVFISILFNHIVDKIGDNLIPIKFSFDTLFVYEILPSIIKEVIKAKFTFLCFFVLTVYLIGASFVVFTSSKFAINFSKQESFSILHLLKSTFWFFAIQITTFILFLLFYFGFYYVSFQIYSHTQKDLFPLVMIVILLTYPIYYAFVSFLSLLSYMHVSNLEKILILKEMNNKSNFVKVYLFYAARIWIEFAFVLFIPLLVHQFQFPKIISAVSVCFGLSFPYAFIRGSSFVFKLEILKNNSTINTFFRNYYSQQSKP